MTLTDYFYNSLQDYFDDERLYTLYDKKGTLLSVGRSLGDFNVFYRDKNVLNIKSHDKGIDIKIDYTY